MSHFLIRTIPGPVIGLVLLLAWFRLRGRIEEPVNEVGSALMRYLGLLFVPAAVGVVKFWPQLAAHWVAVAVALAASAILTVGVTAVVLRAIAGDAQ